MVSKIWKGFQSGYQCVGLLVAQYPKRYEVFGILMIAMAAYAEFGISSYRSIELESKFEGLKERIRAMGEGERLDCSDPKIQSALLCNPGQKTIVVYSESFWDEAAPEIYNPKYFTISKWTLFAFGTFFVMLGKWFDGYKVTKEGSNSTLPASELGQFAASLTGVMTIGPVQRGERRDEGHRG